MSSHLQPSKQYTANSIFSRIFKPNPAISSYSTNLQPFQGISRHCLPFLPFLAISINAGHFQLTPAISRYQAISNPLISRNFQAFPGIYCNFSHFQPYQAMQAISSYFQPVSKIQAISSPEISSHFQPSNF